MAPLITTQNNKPHPNPLSATQTKHQANLGDYQPLQMCMNETFSLGIPSIVSLSFGKRQFPISFLSAFLYYAVVAQTLLLTPWWACGSVETSK